MTDPYRDAGHEDRSILVVAFNRYVFGLRPDSGDVVWKHALSVSSSPIEIEVRYGRVFATNGHELHVLHYPGGAPIKRVHVPDTYKGRPTMVVERERVFLGSQGEVTCFSLDGAVLWTQGFEGAGLGEVALGFPGNLRQADQRGR